ncbi:MAG: GAF domain-containing protein [Deltaproteobacteria bacterium]|nr:GAF domain-containing protein [Deltaproteobacteria bacterium]
MDQTDSTLLPVEEELRNRLSRLIKLRWVALECIVIAILFTEYSLRIPLPTKELYSITLGIFLYNTFFFLFLHTIEEKGSPVLIPRFALVQILVDWLALTLFIHYTGGIESPVILFFFFHAILSIILLPTQLFYFLSTVGIALMTALAILEYQGTISHITISAFVSGPRHQNPMFVVGMLFFFATALYVSTYLSTAIIKRLRLRDKDLIDLLEDKRRAFERIQTLYDLSYKMSSTLDITEILDLAARGTVEVLNVKGCSISVLDPTRKKYKVSGAYGLSDTYLQKGQLDVTKSLPDVLKGKVVFVPDVTNDPRLQYPEETKREGIASILGIPLIFKGEVIGSLRIHSAEPKNYTKEELEFINAIANTMSLAIANAMAYNKLIEFDKARSRFMNMVAHEMRAPVGAIQNMLQVILNGYVGEITPKQQELLGRAEARTYSFLAMINDLLDLGSHEAELEVYTFSDVCLQDILSKVLDFLEVQIRNKNLTVKVEKPDGPLVVSEVGDDMEKLFTNLIGNAIKYSPSNGTVSVGISVDNGIIKIVIADTGIGIILEDIPHIFDEFFRAKNARLLEKEGTGLGLTIVKRIVDRYDGKIYVDSEPEKGTTFTVIIPQNKSQR